MTDANVAAVVIMAAGQGVRMKSARAKVLHEVAGRSMIAHAIKAANALAPDRLVVVVGHQREQVRKHLDQIAPHALVAVQEQQLGTGDAVRSGLAALPDVSGEVVVTSGDVPLLEGETLRRLVADHRQAGSAVTVLTAIVPDATGYGRIIREDGEVAAIVEHRDADQAQREIGEINSGIYVFDSELLRDGLAALTSVNTQGELYLTDVIAFARQRGLRVGAHVLADYLQVEGVNNRIELAARNAELNRRILRGWMFEGVTVVDPDTTWIHAGVDLAADVTLKPGTSLEGATSVAAGAVIGPDTTLIDVEVAESAEVVRTHAVLAVIGAGASVGPFSYLRPGTQVGEGAKIGAFVEAKNAQVGPGAKVPHLTYCGDAVIGEGANIGAGTIFANYDGVVKSVTHVGANTFVGSDSVLVAPLNIADGSYVAAGSVITRDVGAGELAVARGQQRNITGWVDRRRAGTATQKSANDVAQTRDNTDGEDQE
ncbi:MAG: bifunctional UDP-N-acetylglucosamine diphosphorylase/glucosamine-1-phosphate N-acetyltransferase GlmU [Propionibacteriaceae bacterium]|jgi:bifunctional UDP-N-acetylglucosamine pyrophosphorylase/glucosamine-1-phosphate N-acetyltransferase|nr:bifunctional UDP-N-acetylglucosamine diphosphorylase/glucosamine-1-phosphate N-acetyltransferase GlmU [Propionibacteriaceae bacterium]